MSFSLSGKTAIVTGAASGVGLAIARHFAAQGANVVFADADEAALAKACAGLGENCEGRALAMPVDLRARLSVANLVSATQEAFDHIDILVNAARTAGESDLLEPEEDQVLPMLEANLLGPLRLCQAVARRMIARAEREGRESGASAAQGSTEAARPEGQAAAGPDAGSRLAGLLGAPAAAPASAGAIVNLSSLVAGRVVPGQAGLSIALAALEQMTRTLAVELAPQGVRVNGLALASVLTPALGQQIKEQPALRQAVLQGTPLGRIAAPVEVVHAAQFLASEASGFMTGQVLTIDGGRSLLGTLCPGARGEAGD